MSLIRKGSTQLLIANYRYDVFFKFLIKFVSLINQIIQVKVLGLSILGNLVFYSSIPSFFQIIINQGMLDGLSRWIPDIKENRSKDIFSFINLSFLMMFLLMGPLLFLFWSYSKSFYNIFNVTNFNKTITIMIIVQTIAMVISSPINVFLRTNYDNLFINVTDTVFDIFRIVIFYVLFFGNKLNLFNLLMTTTVLVVLKMVCLVVRYLYFNRMNFVIKLSTSDIIEFFLYSYKMMINGVGGYLISFRGAAFYIQLYMGAVSLGVYSIVRKVIESAVSLLFPKSVGMSVSYMAIETNQKSGMQSMNQFMRKYFNLCWIVLIAIMSLVIINIKHVLGLYGLSYFDNRGFILSMIFYYYFSSWFGFFTFYISLYKRNILFIFAKVVTFIISVPLYMVLLDKLALSGAALVLIVLAVVEALIYFHVIKNINPGFFPMVDFFKLFMVFAIFIVLTYVISIFISNIFIENMILMIMFVVFYYSGFVEKEIKDLILKTFKLRS